MEFMLVLYEDPDLVATDEQHKEAVERVGEYAMGLLSEGTLKNHLKHIYEKLGVSNRTEAAHAALQRGYVRPG